jgi:hypothetical protein
MKLTFDTSQYFSVPDKLHSILNAELEKLTPSDLKPEGIIFNFKDPTYSPVAGGFHDVEFRLELSKGINQKELWQFLYITDFSFQGDSFPELAIEIDVCFIAKQVYSVYAGWLEETAGRELKELFLSNFISYITMEVYQIEITFY